MADSKMNRRKSDYESPPINTIDPNLTNETIIMAKLKAHMAGMNCSDNNTIAVSDTATAIGADTKALRFASTAQGASTVAAGVASNSQGINSIAAGTASTAQGYNTTASGLAATTQGIATNALEIAALAEGQNTTASGQAAHAEGVDTIAGNLAAHAEGYDTSAQGVAAHAEGIQTLANEAGSHAEGFRTKANGVYSHAEGAETEANGAFSHAEGNITIANGDFSHTEGQNTIAQGAASHAEGNLSVANGNYSHAEGYTTNASGLSSHAEGNVTIASGLYTHAEGNNTTTAAQEGAHIMGKYGDARFPYSWHLANGTDANNRGLAAVIRNDGQGIADNGWVTGNADFAEMFETLSGMNIPPGFFVTLQQGKIRRADSQDDYILGVTSAAPAFLGDAEDLKWKGKYIKDEWGRVKYKKVAVSAQVDKNGNVIAPKRIEMRPEINPEWYSSMEYVPRSERPEWVAVALIGKVLVRDDGTCRDDGYCMPNDYGIATASKRGYRVIKRTGPGQILILVK